MPFVPDKQNFVPDARKTRGSFVPDFTEEEREKYIPHTMSRYDPSITEQIVTSIKNIGNAMKAFPNITTNVMGIFLRPRPNDEIAKGLGFKNAQEMREIESQAAKEKLLESSNQIEQITGGLLSAAIDPVALKAGAFGMTARGFSRLLYMGASGAGYGAGLEATTQLADVGDITDPGQVAELAIWGGIGVPVIDKTIRIASRIKSNRALNSIEKEVKKNIDEGLNPQAAYDQVLESKGFKPEEIASVVDSAGRKLQFKLPAKHIADDEIVRNGIISNYGNKGKSIISSTKKTVDEIMEPISSRIRKINVGVFNAARKAEQQAHELTNNWRRIADPWIQSISKLPKSKYKELSKAVQNQNYHKAYGILNTLPAREANIAKEALTNVRSMLDDILAKYRETGLDVGYLEDFYPRSLKNGKYKDFIKQVGGQERVRVQRAAQARYNKSDLGELTDKQGSDLLNSFLVGSEPRALGGARATKHRVVDNVTDDIAPFYADIRDSLTSYIDNAASTIAERRFFGKHLTYADDINSPMDDSIGTFVMNLWRQGEIKTNQIDELQGLLKSRFGYKESAGVLQPIKNLFYTTKLSQVSAALTQLADLSISAYVNGLANTMRGMLKINGLNAKDIGVVKIAADFGSTSKTAKLLDRTLSPFFKPIDQLGKNAFIRGSLIKNTKLANRKGGEPFRKKWQEAFGDETEDLINDLRSGDVTDNVKLMLWNELANVQPISLLEMPQVYLNNPNGRIFYALQSFTIKQLDLIRRDSLAKMRHGKFTDKVAGAKNLMHFAMFFTAANMTTDQIKAWITGREVDYNDLFVANLWKNIGLSKYVADNLASGKGLETLFDMTTGGITAPLQTLNNILEDLKKVSTGQWELKESGAIKDVPLFGKLIYDIFGEGMEKYKAEQIKKRLNLSDSEYEDFKKLNDMNKELL